MKADRAGDPGCCRRRRFRPHRLIALLGAIGTLLALPALAGAHGAHFTYELCDSALPGGGAPAWDFHTNPGAAYTPWQTCASPGGAIGISQTGQVSNTPAWINLGVASPPEGYVESITISAAAWNFQPGNDGHVYDDGWPLSINSFTTRMFHVRSEPSIFFQGAGFSMVLSCSASPCNPGATIAASNIAVTEVDVVPPRVKKTEGPMLGGGSLRGHQALSAEATDVGGGLANLEVRVNGLPAGVPTSGVCAVARVSNASYEGIAATSPSPCPGRLTGTWLVDTAGAPFQNGANTLQVCASDFSTNGDPNTSCSAPQTVEVNNTCTESQVTGGQTLSANFSQSNSDSVTVPFGKPADVTGTLANNAGDPISGATICIQARTQGAESGPHPVGVATTDAQGHFAYELPPGPNRDVLVGYRHDAFQVARTISYRARAQPTIRIRPGRVRAGDRIRITGKLPGPSAAGRSMIVQASSLHGSRWLTFRQVTTGPHGGYALWYRLGNTDSTITYRIRALVPRQHDYPLEPGHSESARVKVRG